MSSFTSGRAAAVGAQLAAVHQDFRNRLVALRADPASAPRSLAEHCIAFCAALHRHHTSEDATTFPLLADAAPELRPVLAKLAEDHVVVDGILGGVEALVESLPDDPDAAAVEHFRRELDGLSAIMESHFAVEERRITAALDALPAGHHTAAELFGTTGSARVDGSQPWGGVG